jgi:hypothetical protein
MRKPVSSGPSVFKPDPWCTPSRSRSPSAVAASYRQQPAIDLSRLAGDSDFVHWRVLNAGRPSALRTRHCRGPKLPWRGELPCRSASPVFSEPGDFKFNWGQYYAGAEQINYSSGSGRDHTGQGIYPTRYDRSRTLQCVVGGIGALPRCHALFPIALHFWHSERCEQVHSTSAHRLGFGWRSYNPAPKSMHQRCLRPKG